MNLSPASVSVPGAIALKARVQGQGYPILCLHGHPGRGASMAVFTDHLCQRFRTIAPDLRGYGQSQVSQPFQMTDHLLDLEALLDRYQVETCLVLGWSLGGILAMELALRLRDRIRGLILVATAARPRGSHPPIAWQDNLYTGIAALINLVYPGWQWNIDAFGRRSLFRYLVQQQTEVTYRYLADAAVPAYWQTSRQANQALQTALRDRYSRLEELDQIQAPCLMLCGAEDRHITAASSLETAARLPDCQAHCYPETAHLFPWEIPSTVQNDIDQWLHQHSELWQS